MAKSSPLPLLSTRYSLFATHYSARTHTLCPAGCAQDVPTRLGSDVHAHRSPPSLRVRQPCGAAELESEADGAEVAGAAGVVAGSAAGASVDGVSAAGGVAGVVSVCVGGVGCGSVCAADSGAIINASAAAPANA